MDNITKEKLKKLKEDWLKDPSFDLKEDAELKKYRKDLLIFKLTYEQELSQERYKKMELKLQVIKELLGIDSIENRLIELENKAHYE